MCRVKSLWNDFKCGCHVYLFLFLKKSPLVNLHHICWWLNVLDKFQCFQNKKFQFWKGLEGHLAYLLEPTIGIPSTIFYVISSHHYILPWNSFTNRKKFSKPAPGQCACIGPRPALWNIFEQVCFSSHGCPPESDNPHIPCTYVPTPIQLTNIPPETTMYVPSIVLGTW